MKQRSFQWMNIYNERLYVLFTNNPALKIVESNDVLKCLFIIIMIKLMTIQLFITQQKYLIDKLTDIKTCFKITSLFISYTHHLSQLTRYSIFYESSKYFFHKQLSIPSRMKVIISKSMISYISNRIYLS